MRRFLDYHLQEIAKGSKLIDPMYPYYNKTRREAAQDKANQEAFRKLFRPDSQTITASKQLLFVKLQAEFEKTLDVLVGNYGYDQWNEEFTDDELQTGEDWCAEFVRNHRNKAEFARGCKPIIAERCFTNVEGGSCKSADGFDWFGFWDAEGVDYLKSAEEDYIDLHRQIRAASIQQTEGCFDTKAITTPLAPPSAFKKRRFDDMDGKGKMEDSEENDCEEGDD